MTETCVVMFESNGDTTIWRGNGVNPAGESYVQSVRWWRRERKGIVEIGIGDVTIGEIERRMFEHGLRVVNAPLSAAAGWILRANLVRLFFGYPHGSAALLERVVYDESIEIDDEGATSCLT